MHHRWQITSRSVHPSYQFIPGIHRPDNRSVDSPYDLYLDPITLYLDNVPIVSRMLLQDARLYVVRISIFQRLLLEKNIDFDMSHLDYIYFDPGITGIECVIDELRCGQSLLFSA